MIQFKSKLSITAPETLVMWTDVSGNTEEVSFFTNAFGKDTFATVDIYEQLNHYLVTLSVNEQRAIYEAFVSVRYNLDNTINMKDLIANLKVLVATISELIDPTKIYHWVKNYSNIKIPPGFEDTYKHDINNNNSQEKTYLKDDYIHLLGYCIALKAYVPIWGEYINLIRREIGTDFKEYNSFQLLNNTQYINTRSYQKLLTYVEHIITEDMFNSYNVINNINSEDYVYYVFCLTNVRKLPFIEIKTIGVSEEENKLNIITYVYKYIKHKIKGNSNPKNIVKDKNTTSASIDENSKISVLEKYKIKTNISLEDIVELEFSVKDTYTIAQRLSTNSSMDMLTEALKTANQLNYAKIPDTSIRLLQWVMKPVISPRGIMYLSKPALVNLLAVLQTVLYARGYKYLALLATTQRVVNSDQINVFSIDSKNKIPQELVDRLDQLYPFTKPVKVGRVSKIESRYIISTIDNFTNGLSANVLKMTAEDKLIEEVFGNNNRKMSIHPEVKTMLAKLLVEVGSRSWI